MGRYSVHIVGESHYQDAIALIDEGDLVEFWHEDENPHDPRAIQVRSDDESVLGYLARDSWLTRHLLDEGGKVVATIESIIGGGPGEMLGVVLEVLTAKDALESATEIYSHRQSSGIFAQIGLAALASVEAQKNGTKSKPKPFELIKGCLALIIIVVVIVALIRELVS